MSMSTSVQAFISPDNDTYKKHAKVLIACVEANIEKLPKETAKYFGCEYPELYLLEQKLEIKLKISEYSDGISSQGYELLVSDIPEGTYKIRFSNNW